MKQITFPLSTQNVAEVVAERDAEIERLRKLCAERPPYIIPEVVKPK